MNNKIKTEYSALSIEIVNAEVIDVIVTSGFNSEDDDFVKKTSEYNLDDDTLS